VDYAVKMKADIQITPNRDGILHRRRLAWSPDRSL